jgi:hypothetical protein
MKNDQNTELFLGGSLKVRVLVPFTLSVALLAIHPLKQSPEPHTLSVCKKLQCPGTCTQGNWCQAQGMLTSWGKNNQPPTYLNLYLERTLRRHVHFQDLSNFIHKTPNNKKPSQLQKDSAVHILWKLCLLFHWICSIHGELKHKSSIQDVSFNIQFAWCQ